MEVRPWLKNAFGSGGPGHDGSPKAGSGAKSPGTPAGQIFQTSVEPGSKAERNPPPGIFTFHMRRSLTTSSPALGTHSISSGFSKPQIVGTGPLSEQGPRGVGFVQAGSSETASESRRTSGRVRRSFMGAGLSIGKSESSG